MIFRHLPLLFPLALSCLSADSPPLEVAEGFEAEKIYDVPKKTQGSWVALTTDGKGRLIASDQGGQGLFRITVGADGDPGNVKVEKIPAKISKAQGLLWAYDSLFVHVNPDGFFRVTDSDGDDMLDKVEQLNSNKGGGEHGNHAVLFDEEEKNFFLVAGNHTNLPKDLVKASTVTSWDEDLLLPRQWDARGHARGRLAPGGWICRVTPDGKNFKVHSMGYRNQYDAALNRFDDLFAYDADMEWDLGSPWYRPTRICHAVSGSDFGWRSGTGKWPTYYEDSLPPVIDIGPGSPTGVASGIGTKFPTKYQDAIYALDWTFGTMYAIHLKPQGASYVAEAEEFVSGVPLPLTDAVVGKDGALYFTTGGRGTNSALWRITYVGDESTAAPTDPGPADAAEARALRRSLEVFHGKEDAKALEAAWPHLKSEDRFIRHAARVAVESQPVEQWADRALKETHPQARVTAAVALARTGEKELGPKLTGALLSVDPSTLSEGQFLGLLRAYALNFIRLGEPTDEARKQVIAQLDPHLPSKSADLNTELVRVLVYLDAPNIITKTMALIENPAEPEVPAWGELVTRNGRYGGPIKKMMDNPAPTREIGYAFMLRNVRYGWTMKQRRAYITFLNEAAKFPGGASFAGFLKNLRSDSLQNASDAERAALADLTGEELTPELGFEVTPPKGPGQAWTMETAMKVLDAPGALTGRDFAAGRNLFHATSCVACHRFDGTGGAIGPDLTTVRNKFNTRDLVESIIHPSKVISDQYGSSTVTRNDGTTVTGLVVEDGDLVEVYTSDPSGKPVSISHSDIQSIAAVPVSQMPPGLINTLSAGELRDFAAYLLSRGNPNDPMFKK